MHHLWISSLAWKRYLRNSLFSRYHNGKFYFNRPIEISSEVIYKLTGLSNQGDLVPIGIKEGLVERLTGTTIGKNSKGLMISQLQARTPQIVAKIIATGLTPTDRVSDLKLDILEAVDTIACTGKFYRWAQCVADMIKTICEKCQDSTGIIRFPSLIIWIAMYHLCPVGDKQCQEPRKYHMWRFKPFSHNGMLKELENGKVMLENWFQNLKLQTTRWRVPQNIRRSLPKISHIQLEIDHTAVWYMQGQKQ